MLDAIGTGVTTVITYVGNVISAITSASGAWKDLLPVIGLGIGVMFVMFAITTVKGFVSKTVTQSITSNTDRVLLDELEVSQITSVKQGSKTYTVGTATSGDCYLQREGTRYYLKWNGTENYPTLNVSYDVIYTYNHLFIEGTDYSLTHKESDDSHNLTWNTSGAHSFSFAGINPPLIQ